MIAGYVQCMVTIFRVDIELNCYRVEGIVRLIKPDKRQQYYIFMRASKHSNRLTIEKSIKIAKDIIFGRPFADGNLHIGFVRFIFPFSTKLFGTSSAQIVGYKLNQTDNKFAAILSFFYLFLVVAICHSAELQHKLTFKQKIGVPPIEMRYVCEPHKYATLQSNTQNKNNNNKNKCLIFHSQSQTHALPIVS